MATFKVMLHYELERVKANSLQKTSIAVINLENIFELYNKVGKKAEKNLLEDLVKLIRENIRTTDFIAFENSSTLYLGMINSDSMQAEQQLMQLSIVIEKVIKTNFDGFHVKVLHKNKLLHSHSKSELQLQELTKDLFD
jgi:hypothetical protein